MKRCANEIVKVFLSSNCDGDAQEGYTKYGLMRKSIKVLLEETQLCSVYAFEAESASSNSVVDSYISVLDESNDQDIGKCDFHMETQDLYKGNIAYIHILDLLKNEYFGEILMFLNIPNPLSLKVKTKQLIGMISKQFENLDDISSLNDSNIEQEIGKCDFQTELQDLYKGNIEYIHILDLLKNEYFGEILMFLNIPNPLSLKVKTKRVELYILRKKRRF